MKATIFCRRWCALRFCLSAAAVFILYSNGWGQQEHYFITINSMIARPLAMGGAYVAVQDELAASLYNPANLGGVDHGSGRGVRIFLNPLTPAIALADPTSFFHARRLSIGQALSVAGLLIKGFTVRAGPFDFGGIIGEQSTRFDRLPRAKGFEAENYLDNQYSILAVRMRVAERVSVGASIGLYYQRLAEADREWKIQASYGVTLTPGRKLLVGVSYITLPSDLDGSYRDHPERLVNGSVNLGISLKPWTHTVLSFDVHNLADDREEMVREPHIGIEQAFLSLVALRVGAFRKNDRSQIAWTAGLGLIEARQLFSPNRRSSQPGSSWVVNYGVVFEKDDLEGSRYIHALSLVVAL